MTKFEFKGNIHNNPDGLSELASLFSITKDLSFDTIKISFKNVDWFDANLAAILGAILSSLSNDLNHFEMIDLNDDVRKILEKNGFLSKYGRAARNDSYGTTIKFSKFGSGDLKAFEAYLEAELFMRTDLPAMSEKLTKKIFESMLEIFNNAAFHGASDYIFSCGQCFPKKNNLNFTLVNLGHTVKERVSEFKKQEISADKALSWAIKPGNTTRVGSIPGGMGLNILREFMKLNKGQVQIYSDSGYWTQNNKAVVTCAETEFCFNGTIVNFQFNISDDSSYRSPCSFGHLRYRQLLAFNKVDDFFS